MTNFRGQSMRQPAQSDKAESTEEFAAEAAGNGQFRGGHAAGERPPGVRGQVGQERMHGAEQPADFGDGHILQRIVVAGCCQRPPGKFARMNQSEGTPTRLKGK